MIDFIIQTQCFLKRGCNKKSLLSLFKGYFVNVVFIRFLFVGIANTVLGLCLISFFMYAVKVTPEKANIYTYSIGLVVSFVLNKKFTYRCKDRQYFKQFFLFFIVFLLAFIFNFITLKLLLNYMPKFVAQFLAMCVFTFTQYILNLLITFNKKL